MAMAFRGTNERNDSRLTSDPTTASSRIFIGNLGIKELNRTQLTDKFGKHGNITACSLNRGFAFVQFDSDASAQEAIQQENGTIYLGKKIEVKPARAPNRPGGNMPSSGAGDSGRIPDNGRPDMIRDRSPLDDRRDWRDRERFEGFPGAGGPPMDRGGGDRPWPKDHGPMDMGPMDRDMELDRGIGDIERGPMDRARGPMDVDLERGPMDRDVGPMDRGRMDRDRGPMDRGPMDRRQMDRERGPMDRERGPMDRGPIDRERGPMDRERGPMDRGLMDRERGPMDRGPMDRERGPMDRGPMDRERGPMDRGLMDRDRGLMDRGLMDRERGPMDRGPMDRERGPMDRGPIDRERGPLDRGLMDRERGHMDRGPLDRERGPMDRGPMDRGPMEYDSMDRGGFYSGDRNGKFPPSDNFRPGPPGFRPGMADPPRAGPLDYGSPVVNIATADRTNDCEIIVVDKINREYAEYIERRLKQLGLTVDLLFPNEVVPIPRVLANISSRGSLYAIVVLQQNEEHRSLTLNILHGLPEEHRNMPLEAAVSLISRNFEVYIRGEKSGTSVPGAVSVGGALPTKDRHPEPIQALITLLNDNRQLTALQYEKVLHYLENRRQMQITIELGDAKDIGPPPRGQGTQQVELQHRILNILNSSAPPAPVVPVAPSVPAWQSQSDNKSVPPLLNDPTVQKALDSLIQGDLLRKISGPGNQHNKMGRF